MIDQEDMLARAVDGVAVADSAALSATCPVHMTMCKECFLAGGGVRAEETKRLGHGGNKVGIKVVMVV